MHLWAGKSLEFPLIKACHFDPIHHLLIALSDSHLFLYDPGIVISTRSFEFSKQLSFKGNIRCSALNTILYIITDAGLLYRIRLPDLDYDYVCSLLL